MHFLAKHKEILILSILILAFFYIYSFSLGPQNFSKSNSPDETANYFWTQHFAQNQGLSYPEPLNTIGNNLLRPRSLNVVGANVVPGSFLGQIVIYGWLAKFLGIQAIPYLTPFFACLGVIFFFLIISLLFNKKIALISGLLILFFPGWWYYAARGMYHNILFLSLFLMGIYFLVLVLRKKQSMHAGYKIFLYILSGTLVGLSLITRTSELVWVALTVLLIFLVNFKKIYWPGFILFIGGLALGALPMFYYNQILYGSLISAGYQSVVRGQGIGQIINSGILFKILVTPFGLDLESIWTNALNYLFKFLPLWSISTTLGFILFLFLPHKVSIFSIKKKILISAFSLLLIIYLLTFYGSWSVTDRIDQGAFSLGTSYLRYWLPIYLLFIPFIGFLIYWFIGLFKYKWLQHIILFFIILFMFLPSANLVLTDTDESLINIHRSLINSQNKLRTIQQKLPDSNAVIIIYKQADKTFFPEYKRLITDLVVPADYLALSRIAKFTNLYYYTFEPPRTVEYVSRRYFEPHGLKITNGQKVFEDDFVYQVISTTVGF